MAGDQATRVLGASRALEHRLGEVAGLGGKGDQWPHDQPGLGGLAEGPQDDGADDGRGDDPADQPGVRLRRRDVAQESRPAVALAEEVRPCVVRPHSEDEQEDPAAIRSETGQRRAGGDRGRLVAEPQDESQQGGVQGPEHRREPRREAVTRVRPGEGADRGQDRPDGDEERATRVDRRDDRSVEDDRDRQRDPEPGERRVAGTGEEPEHLAGRQAGGDDDDGHDPGAAEQQGQHERRDEERRTHRALTEHAGGGRAAVQRPNRRVRLANSSSAASNAADPKSGQRTSVV